MPQGIVVMREWEELGCAVHQSHKRSWNLICITSSNVNSFKIIKFFSILPSFAHLSIENGKKSHRIKKFNTFSVNVILFQGNQKNIWVGLSGRNNADSGLFTKEFERFPDYQEEAQFLVTHGCEIPKNWKANYFRNLRWIWRVLIPNLSRFEKILLSALWQGSLGSSV